MLQTETPEQELERLIREQEADDTPLVRPEGRLTFSLDATWNTQDPGGDDSFANLIGITEQGEIISFIRPARGEVLNGTASYHGTDGGYTNQRCRCTKCRKAHSEAHSRRQQVRKSNPIPQRVHGTYNGYSNYGCRCDSCALAAREYRKQKAAA